MIVDGAHGHLGGFLAVVDEPQQAHLVAVAAGIEDGDGAVVTARGRQVVQCGDEAVGRARVAEHLDVQVAAEVQAPVAGARADAVGQTLGGIAVFEVLGVEVHDLIGVHRERHRVVAAAVVVGGVDDHPAGRGEWLMTRTKPLVDGARGGGEQGDHLAQGDVEGQGLGGAFVVGTRDGECPRPCGVGQGDPEFAVDDFRPRAVGIVACSRGLHARTQGRVEIAGDVEARRACVRRHQQPDGVDADVHAAVPQRGYVHVERLFAQGVAGQGDPVAGVDVRVVDQGREVRDEVVAEVEALKLLRRAARGLRSEIRFEPRKISARFPGRVEAHEVRDAGVEGVQAGQVLQGLLRDRVVHANRPPRSRLARPTPGARGRQLPPRPRDSRRWARRRGPECPRTRGWGCAGGEPHRPAGSRADRGWQPRCPGPRPPAARAGRCRRHRCSTEQARTAWTDCPTGRCRTARYPADPACRAPRVH